MSERYLFERIMSCGWAGLVQWQADKEPERFQLEFKGRGHASPKVKDYDRDAVAKAVSGFANTSGGVLVVGVDTAKDPTMPQLDRFDRLDAADKLAAYVQAINDHARTCVVPPVPGVQAMGIEDSPGSDRGVVVLYVPSSDGGPHRVVVGSDEVKNHYFARIGTSFQVLTHELLAAMFGRRPPPRLRLALDVELERKVVFHVVNEGRGIARDVLVSVETMRVQPPELAQHDLQVLSPWTRAFPRNFSGSRRPPRAFHFALYPPHVIHPDDVQRIGQVDLTHPASVRLRGRIDSDGMSPVNFDTEVSPSAGALTLVPAIGDEEL